MTDWLADQMAPQRIGLGGWLRVLARGVPLIGLVYGGLAVLLLVRLAERPLFGTARPITPGITRLVCRTSLRLVGLPLIVRGTPMKKRGAIVANHSGWMDIFVLNAIDRVYFVAKAEVAGWAAIGWLARATGTLFITRKGTEAKRQQSQFEERLIAGHRLLFFPEGTSTDSQRVLPFKSTLFAAFFAPSLVGHMHIQPVTVAYRAPPDADPRTYGWWGKMAFAPHLLAILALPRQGRVEVTFHPEVPVDAFVNRKELALHCERVINATHAGALARAL